MNEHSRYDAYREFSYEEIQRLVKRGNRLRAEAIHAGLTRLAAGMRRIVMGLWSLLTRRNRGESTRLVRSRLQADAPAQSDGALPLHRKSSPPHAHAADDGRDSVNETGKAA